MKALNTTESIQTPQNVVIKYIHVYKKAGISEETYVRLSKEYDTYHTISKKEDLYYCYKLLFPEYDLTDSRIKSIISKDGKCELKNNKEKVLRNLIRIFDRFESSNGKYIPFANDIESLAKSLYKDVDTVRFKTKIDGDLYKTKLEKLCDRYAVLKKEAKVEFGYLNLAFYLDLIKLAPFSIGNSEVAMLILYALIINSDINVFTFIPFFKLLYERRDEFNSAIDYAFYRYDVGYPELFRPLYVILDIESNAYTKLEEIKRDKEFDKEMSKAMIIENIIYKLDPQFKKSDIREMAPNISDSTIDRVLTKLSEEGKIRAFDVGRNASWLRIDDSYDKSLF